MFVTRLTLLSRDFSRIYIQGGKSNLLEIEGDKI